MKTCSSQFNKFLKTVWGMQRSSPQFSQILRQWDNADMLLPIQAVLEGRQGMQTYFFQFSHLRETVRAIQTCSSQFSQLLRGWGHADMLLYVPLASGYSLCHGDMLLSVQSASETVGT